MDVRATATQPNGTIPNGIAKQSVLDTGVDRLQIIDDQKHFTLVAGIILLLLLLTISTARNWLRK